MDTDKVDVTDEYRDVEGKFSNDGEYRELQEEFEDLVEKLEDIEGKKGGVVEKLKKIEKNYFGKYDELLEYGEEVVGGMVSSRDNKKKVGEIFYKVVGNLRSASKVINECEMSALKNDSYKGSSAKLKVGKRLMVQHFGWSSKGDTLSNEVVCACLQEFGDSIVNNVGKTKKDKCREFIDFVKLYSTDGFLDSDGCVEFYMKLPKQVININKGEYHKDIGSYKATYYGRGVKECKVDVDGFVVKVDFTESNFHVYLRGKYIASSNSSGGYSYDYNGYEREGYEDGVKWIDIGLVNVTDLKRSPELLVLVLKNIIGLQELVSEALCHITDGEKNCYGVLVEDLENKYSTVLMAHEVCL